MINILNSNTKSEIWLVVNICMLPLLYVDVATLTSARVPLTEAIQN